jgi:hypothetical protein
LQLTLPPRDAIAELKQLRKEVLYAGALFIFVGGVLAVPFLNLLVYVVREIFHI